jgi:hypothetical protein
VTGCPSLASVHHSQIQPAMNSKIAARHQKPELYCCWLQQAVCCCYTLPRAPNSSGSVTFPTLNLCCVHNLPMYKMPPLHAAADTDYKPAGSKLRICSFCVLLSCRGKVTSYLMMRLPRCPGCLLIGIPSPLQQQQPIPQVCTTWSNRARGCHSVTCVQAVNAWATSAPTAGGV